MNANILSSDVFYIYENQNAYFSLIDDVLSDKRQQDIIERQTYAR